MSIPNRSHVQNRLLRSLSDADFALLEPELQRVPLDQRKVLVAQNAPIEHVYFPDCGIASIVATTGQKTRVEVGVFGRDGMSATALLLGADRSPHECFVQVEGSGLRIEAERLLGRVRASSSLQTSLLRYVQVLNVQTAHTALANGSYGLEERLARWLLMCHDRVDGDQLALTHEFLAMMLAVRRSGVTVATQVLEGARIIKAQRGRITILDRAKLEEVADEGYGAPEAEFERLIGPWREHRRPPGNGPGRR